MARPSTIDEVLALTEPTAGRWLEAARDGLADPALRSSARKVVELGAGCLDHLDLSPAQQTRVFDDLTVRLETTSTNRRHSA